MVLYFETEKLLCIKKMRFTFLNYKGFHPNIKLSIDVVLKTRCHMFGLPLLAKHGSLEYIPTYSHWTNNTNWRTAKIYQSFDKIWMNERINNEYVGKIQLECRFITPSFKYSFFTSAQVANRMIVVWTYPWLAGICPGPNFGTWHWTPINCNEDTKKEIRWAC